MSAAEKQVTRGYLPETLTEASTVEAAIYLGVSTTRIHQFRKEKRLRARFDKNVNPHGAWYITRQSLEQLKAERDCFPLTAQGVYMRGAVAHEGNVAAEAFRLFDEKKTVSEVVKILRVKPDRIRRLWEEYKTPLGQRVMTPETERELWEREKTIKELQIQEDRARAALLKATAPTLHANGKAKS